MNSWQMTFSWFLKFFCISRSIMAKNGQSLTNDRQILVLPWLSNYYCSLIVSWKSYEKHCFNWEGTLVLICFENLLHSASTPKDIIQKKLEQLSVTIARIETLFAPSASKLKIVSKPKLKVHSNYSFFHLYVISTQLDIGQ